MLTSSTDSAKFRPLGITAYGFEPFKLDDNELNRSHEMMREFRGECRLRTAVLYEVVVGLN